MKKVRFWNILEIAGVLSFLMTWVQLAFTWENSSVKFVTIMGFWLVISIVTAFYSNFRLTLCEESDKT